MERVFFPPIGCLSVVGRPLSGTSLKRNKELFRVGVPKLFGLAARRERKEQRNVCVRVHVQRGMHMVMAASTCMHKTMRMAALVPGCPHKQASSTHKRATSNRAHVQTVYEQLCDGGGPPTHAQMGLPV